MTDINSIPRVTLAMPLKRALLVWLCALTTLHCSKTEEYVENQIRKQLAPPGQLPSTRPEPVIEEAIKINSVQPNRGETLGGTLIEVIGLGFEECMEVRLGPSQQQCTHLEFLSATNLRCVTPPYPSPERVTLRIIRPSTCGTPETAILERGFEYFEPVEVNAIAPARGPTAGGTLVVINGEGFIEGTTARFGSLEPITATVIDSTTLTISTPSLPRDVYAITVANMNGSATLPAAFTTFEPVHVEGVAPFAGPLSGGTDVIVTGTGFVAPTSLSFGTQPMTATPNFDANRLSGSTVPASPATEGSVDITASNENGEHTRLNAFVYYDPDNTTPRIIAATPPVGLIAGGTTVNIVVAFLPGVPMEVRFGENIATCTSLNNFMMECVLPPGPEGSVTIEIDAGGQTFSLPAGFTYLDLRLTSLSPTLGAVAGGTWMQVVGNGFQADTQILFDGRPGRDLSVVDSQHLTLWTPPGAIGTVDVSVETLGLRVTNESFFSYFDPANMNEWTSGDPIDGAINVTVFENGRGERVPGAFVMAGSAVDPARPYLSGFTDERGQITLSGPDVAGLQTVHAGKADLGNFSWIDTNAQNLTMMLSAPEPPSPDPLPPCPEPSGLLPPIFRGNVVRIKDEFNTGNDTVVVTTTYADFSQPLPDPGSRSVLTSSGEYELVSRSGDLILIALAGTPTPEGSLEVHAMGFHPYLFAEPSSGSPCDTGNECSEEEQCLPLAEGSFCIRIYDDVDIVIDTPVNHPMHIEMDNAPLGGPFDSGLPSSVAANIWYDFGYMGLHMMDSVRLDGEAAAQSFDVKMPKRLPGSLVNSSFNIVGGVYNNVAGSLYPPQSESRLFGLTDTTAPILLSPYLKTHETLAPQGSVGSPMNFEVNLLPASLPEILPTTNASWLFNFETFIPCEGAMAMQRAVIHWMAFSAPTNTQFFLPIFPDTAGNANMPGGNTYYWQLMAIHTPDVQFNRMNVNAAFGWKSRALQVTPFVYP